MPCNISVTCFVAEHSETPAKSNFITNSVCVANSRNQGVNIFVHVTAFYPKDGTKTCDLDRYKRGDVIHVQGRFSIVETESDSSKIKILKVIASDICNLNLDEEDLPKSVLSVVLVGVASDNPTISNDKITISFSAREYINENQNQSLNFELYHFPEENYLLPISSKVSRGSTLYLTGHLSLVEDLYLVRLTQVNFISSNQSSSYNKSGAGYAWEKNQNNLGQSSSSTPSASDIAKSILSNTPKSRKRAAKRKSETTLTNPAKKIPSLASLALTQPSTSTTSNNNQEEDVNPENTENTE